MSNSKSKSKSKRINATTKITEDQKRKFRLLKNSNFKSTPIVSNHADAKITYPNGFLGHKYAIFVYISATINNVILEGWAPWTPFTVKTNKEALKLFEERIKLYNMEDEKLSDNLDYYTVLKEV